MSASRILPLPLQPGSMHQTPKDQESSKPIAFQNGFPVPNQQAPSTFASLSVNNNRLSRSATWFSPTTPPAAAVHPPAAPQQHVKEEKTSQSQQKLPAVESAVAPRAPSHTDVRYSLRTR